MKADSVFIGVKHLSVITVKPYQVVTHGDQTGPKVISIHRTVLLLQVGSSQGSGGWVEEEERSRVQEQEMGGKAGEKRRGAQTQPQTSNTYKHSWIAATKDVERERRFTLGFVFIKQVLQQRPTWSF